MGLPQGPVRPPLIPLTNQQTEALQADLAGLGLLDSIS
jgi:dihydrodipicolinate synthase/N-acetylneuraminate lyase